MDFKEMLMDQLKDEENGESIYLKMSEIAPTEKAKKILKDIASEEKRHKAFLEEIAEDLHYGKSKEQEKVEDKGPAKHNANGKVIYPDYIENAGVDPDDFMD